MSAEHDAIAAAIEDIDPGAVVTKFVFVAEVIDASGQCNLWTSTHEGAKRWDLAGLLTHALNDLTVEQVVEVLAEADEDHE